MCQQFSFSFKAFREVPYDAIDYDKVGPLIHNSQPKRVSTFTVCIYLFQDCIL